MGGTDNTGIDELGPVDYLVVEFPPGAQNFNGEMAAELVRLSDAGTIRVLDLLILQKAADGSVDAYEIDETDVVDEIRALETHVSEILAADDVLNLAAAMEPGSVAGVLVWENTWAAPFASAARRAGGQLIATGRIPIQAIAASIGVTITDVVSVTEAGATPPQPVAVPTAAFGAATATPTPVEPGELVVRAQVTVVFQY